MNVDHLDCLFQEYGYDVKERTASVSYTHLCGGHHVALRGVASAVGVLVVEVQPSLVEVRLDVLRDGLAVIPLTYFR